MRTVLLILFPWRGTFKLLGLRQRWWHRLASVSFLIALVPMLSASWVVTFGSLQPDHSYMPDIQYWAMDTDGNAEEITFGPPVTQAQFDAAVKQHSQDPKGTFTPLPVGAQVSMAPSAVSIDWSAPIKATVYMPDGTAGEFVGKSDAEIKAIWNKALQKAARKAWLLSIAIAIVATLAFSYLLQSLYRALLYVVFGSTKDRDLTHNGDPASSWRAVS
jgi:hypothetical protein